MLITIKLNVLNHDWDRLREDIKQFGLRHSTLTAQMPSESSSVVSNATNALNYLEITCQLRKVKKCLKQIVPQYSMLKSAYTLLWDMPDNIGYINVKLFAMQKFLIKVSVVTGLTIPRTTIITKYLYQ